MCYIYPCNFNEILSIFDSNSLQFENPSEKEMKAISLKINITVLKNYFFLSNVYIDNDFNCS